MKFLLASIIFLFTINLMANGPATAPSNFSEKKMTFLLPIDVTKKPGSFLSVIIPNNFKSIQNINQFINQNSFGIEYIPQNENPNNWSEIITIHKAIGAGLQAQEFLKQLKSGILANSKQGNIISQSNNHFIIKYQLNNKQEIIGVSYYSGPYDFAGVQYTIRLKDKETIEQGIERVETFFKNNVMIIHN